MADMSRLEPSAEIEVKGRNSCKHLGKESTFRSLMRSFAAEGWHRHHQSWHRASLEVGKARLLGEVEGGYQLAYSKTLGTLRVAKLLAVRELRGPDTHSC